MYLELAPTGYIKTVSFRFGRICYHRLSQTTSGGDKDAPHIIIIDHSFNSFTELPILDLDEWHSDSVTVIWIWTFDIWTLDIFGPFGLQFSTSVKFSHAFVCCGSWLNPMMCHRSTIGLLKHCCPVVRWFTPPVPEIHDFPQQRNNNLDLAT